ncbi:MAG: hypothetical protein U1E76_25620 [Planctomycetota bacterium]
MLAPSPANYDGKKKHRTVVADQAFIGSGMVFVAPAQMGRGAMPTGAGAIATRGTKIEDGDVVVGAVLAEVLRKKQAGHETRSQCATRTTGSRFSPAR